MEGNSKRHSSSGQTVDQHDDAGPSQDSQVYGRGSFGYAVCQQPTVTSFYLWDITHKSLGTVFLGPGVAAQKVV